MQQSYIHDKSIVLFYIYNEFIRIFMIKKGIILAGGNGSRLAPLTKVTNKHLLPVYNKPMIYYPLKTLTNAGIKDILIVTGTESAGDFMKLLGSGEEHQCHLSFRVQNGSGGIADALRLAEGFSSGENIAVILGDNIFTDDFSADIQNFTSGSHIFLKDVHDPQRFGVAELGTDNTVVSIEEKPTIPKSSYAVTGLYLYDTSVFDKIRTLTPSKRGEYEISDINASYIQQNKMSASVLENQWTDAGTHESLFRASEVVRNFENS